VAGHDSKTNLREWVAYSVTSVWVVTVWLHLYDPNRYPIPMAVQVVMGMVTGWLFNAIGRGGRGPLDGNDQ
jgi:hypothetical protein